MNVVVVIDGKSRYIEFSFFKTKDEFQNTLVTCKAAINNPLGRKIKIPHTDNGLEICGEIFNKHMEECSINENISPLTLPTKW